MNSLTNPLDKYNFNTRLSLIVEDVYRRYIALASLKPLEVYSSGKASEELHQVVSDEAQAGEQPLGPVALGDPEDEGVWRMRLCGKVRLDPGELKVTKVEVDDPRDPLDKDSLADYLTRVVSPIRGSLSSMIDCAGVVRLLAGLSPTHPVIEASGEGCPPLGYVFSYLYLLVQKSQEGAWGVDQDVLVRPSSHDALEHRVTRKALWRLVLDDERLCRSCRLLGYSHSADRSMLERLYELLARPCPREDDISTLFYDLARNTREGLARKRVDKVFGELLKGVDKDGFAKLVEEHSKSLLKPVLDSILDELPPSEELATFKEWFQKGEAVVLLLSAHAVCSLTPVAPHVAVKRQKRNDGEADLMVLAPNPPLHYPQLQPRDYAVVLVEVTRTRRMDELEKKIREVASSSILNEQSTATGAVILAPGETIRKHQEEGHAAKLWLAESPSGESVEITLAKQDPPVTLAPLERVLSTPGLLLRVCVADVVARTKQ